MVSVPIYSGLAELSDQYDAYLLDSWGVLQDGQSAFKAANECLRELKKRGKKIVILSNSARRSSVVAAELDEVGVDMKCIDATITGGESAWRSLKQRDDGIYKAMGNKCFYLGSGRSRSLMGGLGLNETTSICDATFILNTGPPDNLSGDELTQLLETAKDCGLSMVCANPDLFAYFGTEKRICAGELARQYENMGARVHYHGKPHRSFYKQALDSLSPVKAAKILAVGDSFLTDLAGAMNMGIDALFVTSGIHRNEFTNLDMMPDKIAELCGDRNIWPAGAIEQLSW